MARGSAPLELSDLRDPSELTHRLFRFPGRFHPPLVTHLLRLHPRAKIVGDPMAGCGTVAVETSAAGKSGIFTDVDPLACLLTRAKSSPVDPAWLERTVEQIIRTQQPFASPGIGRAVGKLEVEKLEKSTDFRAPPNVFHWFSPYVVVNLCRILQGIHAVQASPRKRDALLAIFASILRRVSRADPNTASGLEVTKIRKAELAKGLKFDVVSELRKKTAVAAEGYRALLRGRMGSRLLVVEADAKEWSWICDKLEMIPDLVITSPCYLSAIEYWRRHRLEYCWLGLVDPQDLANIRRRFLGMGDEDPDTSYFPAYLTRLHKKLAHSGFQQEASNFARYFEDSRSWLDEVSNVITSTDGTAYVVVGSNFTRGITIDTSRALQEMASGVGLKSEVLLRYQLTNYHMQYPTKGNIRIREETILRFVPN